MRGIIALVSRNIKIRGSGFWNGGWGCRIFANDWTYTPKDGSPETTK